MRFAEICFNVWAVISMIVGATGVAWGFYGMGHSVLSHF